MWLPSASDGPQPAPELIRPAADADGTRPARWPAALGCWRVPALAIEPSAALRVLAALDRLAAPGEPLAAAVADRRLAADPGERVAAAVADRTWSRGKWLTRLSGWPRAPWTCSPGPVSWPVLVS